MGDNIGLLCERDSGFDVVVIGHEAKRLDRARCGFDFTAQFRVMMVGSVVGQKITPALIKCTVMDGRGGTSQLLDRALIHGLIIPEIRGGRFSPMSALRTKPTLDSAFKWDTKFKAIVLILRRTAWSTDSIESRTFVSCAYFLD